MPALLSGRMIRASAPEQQREADDADAAPPRTERDDQQTEGAAGDDEQEDQPTECGRDPARLVPHRHAPALSPRLASASATTLESSIARVIGPTPPGFGETQPATS